jgi:hypothetical protein
MCSVRESTIDCQRCFALVSKSYSLHPGHDGSCFEGLRCGRKLRTVLARSKYCLAITSTRLHAASSADVGCTTCKTIPTAGQKQSTPCDSNDWYCVASEMLFSRGRTSCVYRSIDSGVESRTTPYVTRISCCTKSRGMSLPDIHGKQFVVLLFCLLMSLAQRAQLHPTVRSRSAHAHT